MRAKDDKAKRSLSSLTSRREPQVRCLLTGFDAFDKKGFNPSQLLVEGFANQISVPSLKNPVVIERMVLPTVGDKAWEALKRALECSSKKSPTILVLTGLAEGRPKLNLERFALNIKDYRIKDNDGKIWQDVPVDSDYPLALRTAVPLQGVERQLKRKGFPVSVSNHAGTFVCNELFFRALAWQLSHSGLVAVLFVHLPMPAVFAKSMLAEGKACSKKLAEAGLLKGCSKQIAQMRLAVAEIIKELAKC